jgi:amyloid beta precursor protein binding protein 1
MTVAPIEKSRRFDRQIRIWGIHGQSRFDEARICLLNASATGGEALKNLVLGGIAAFTIVDGQKVRERQRAYFRPPCKSDEAAISSQR